MLFVKKFSYGIPTPRIPWLEIKVLPDFNDNGHLIEGERPKRGDIVVFRYPKNETIHYVKRAVATGGDIVAVKDKHLLLHPKEGNEFVKANYPKENIIEVGDKLWVLDPYKIDHPGIHNDPEVVNNGLNPMQLFNMMPIIVPEDETFMMGDNRDHSNDSRFWGTVPYKFIVGKPWFVYFSWDDNKEIRWDRVLKSVKSIEEQMDSKNIEIKHEKGIY
jgi:signal peptidase I